MRTAVEVPRLQLLALVVAVPLTASALAWLFTRAALPMSRHGLAAYGGASVQGGPSFGANCLPLAALLGGGRRNPSTTASGIGKVP